MALTTPYKDLNLDYICHLITNKIIMSFKRINNITGWLVCNIASAVYIMTMEATGKFLGLREEFASSAL
jgi:predicted Abi (CAAX) family protease